MAKVKSEIPPEPRADSRRVRSRVGQPPRRLGLSSEDADPRSLLQSRLSTYHLILFGLSGILLPVSLYFVSAIESIEYDQATTFSFVAHIGIVAVSGGSWLVLRRRPLGIGALRVVDAVVAGIIGLCAACWTALIQPTYRPELSMLLAMTQILFARAALVPSEPARTAAVGAAVLLPVVIAVHFAYTLGATPSWLQPASGAPTLALIWAIIIIGLSALTSRIIYGLRRKVEEAMQLGQYTVERLLGRGGMGAVYLARHALLRRPTALKVLESEAAGAEAIARFEREVQTTSELTHPNTVAIYDYGRTPDSSFYYAMEYLDGFDLEALVAADGAQPPARVVHILRQVCGALGEAHSRGLVHRDVKPANIMLCERGRRFDFAKVLDFGLVRDREAGGVELSREQTVRGTPLYMAPESITSPDEVDARADIYGIGGVGYYLLTGRPPFDRKSAIEIMAAQVRDVPEPPSLRAGRPIPPGLERLVLACLEKQPGQRPASMDDLAIALEELDVEPWTHEAARAWWQEHAQSLRSDGKDAASPSDRPPTVAIDLGHRRGGAGLESTQIARAGLV